MRFSAPKSWYVHCSDHTSGYPDASTVSPGNKPFGKSLRWFGPVTIVGLNAMRFRALAVARAVAFAGLLSGVALPAYADARSQAKSQVDFGIKVAQNGLWKEATYRWEKAVEVDPTYAAAWNNLGIGYEHEGRFEDARKAYEKAVALDPKNILIRQNYDLFKEINDRAKRRNDR